MRFRGGPRARDARALHARPEPNRPLLETQQLEPETRNSQRERRVFMPESCGERESYTDEKNGLGSQREYCSHQTTRPRVRIQEKNKTRDAFWLRTVENSAFFS